MRNGQWVKFNEPTIEVNGRSAPLSEIAPNVHRLASGQVVGIFQSRRRDRSGATVPAHICPVDNDRGDNLSVLNIRAGAEETVQFIESAARVAMRSSRSLDLPLCASWPTVEELIESFGLSPVLDVSELPPGRPIAEGFVLRP